MVVQLEATPEEVLSKEQQDAAEQVKVLLQSKGAFEPSRHDNHTIVRFLKGKLWDPPTACEAILKSMAWRRQWGADDIIGKQVLSEARRRRLQQLYPHGVHKTDRHGRPVLCYKIGITDAIALKNEFSEQEIIRFHVQTMEFIMRVALPACCKVAGCRIQQLITLIDLKGIGIWDMPRVKELLTPSMSMNGDNYPGVLASLTIINAPLGFSTVFEAIKRFLNPETQKKILIMGKDFQSTLLKMIPPEHLLEEWGGTSTGLLGDSIGPWQMLPSLPLAPSQPEGVPEAVHRGSYEAVHRGSHEDRRKEERLSLLPRQGPHSVAVERNGVVPGPPSRSTSGRASGDSSKEYGAEQPGVSHPAAAATLRRLASRSTPNLMLPSDDLIDWQSCLNQDAPQPVQVGVAGVSDEHYRGSWTQHASTQQFSDVQVAQLEPSSHTGRRVALAPGCHAPLAEAIAAVLSKAPGNEPLSLEKAATYMILVAVAPHAADSVSHQEQLQWENGAETQEVQSAIRFHGISVGRGMDKMEVHHVDGGSQVGQLMKQMIRDRDYQTDYAKAARISGTGKAANGTHHLEEISPDTGDDLGPSSRIGHQGGSPQREALDGEQEGDLLLGEPGGVHKRYTSEYSLCCGGLNFLLEVVKDVIRYVKLHHP